MTEPKQYKESPEHRAKKSAAQIERFKDPAARKAISDTMTGVPRSPETRAAISRAKTGKPRTDAEKEAIRAGVLAAIERKRNIDN